MTESMNNQQLDTLLETIAKLIEAKQANTEEAAQIVRDAKTRKDPLAATKPQGV